MKSKRNPSYLGFDSKHYAWKADVDYRLNPNQYRVGKGEQGVLICEPYKSEIVRHWHFKTPEIATESSQTILAMFESYLADDDFVGADMARKFLQMGFTRARRYANYKGGRKYDREHDYALNEKGTGDPVEAESAEIFFKAWRKAEADSKYAELKSRWKAENG